MERLTGDELLRHLALKRGAVRTMLGHGFHPLKAQHRWSIPNRLRVHPQGRTPFIDKRVDKADRIVVTDIVINPRRQKLGLVAIAAFNMMHAAILANQFAKANPRYPGNSRFHTVWSVFEKVCRKGKEKSGINLTRRMDRSYR